MTEHTGDLPLSWGGWSKRGLLHAVLPGNATACGKWVEQSYAIPPHIVADSAKCKPCEKAMAALAGSSEGSDA